MRRDLLLARIIVRSNGSTVSGVRDISPTPSETKSHDSGQVFVIG
jgi:hypothetical protein